MACSRHPGAAAHAEYCAACLLEVALHSDDEKSPTAPPAFALEVPLGASPGGSVFLVYTRPPSPRLFRLKRSPGPAPAGFLETFHELRVALEDWSEPSIVMPLNAWIDGERHGCVQTEFRQGVPLVDRVKSRLLAPETASLLLDQLHAVIRAAHRRGLTHGSIGPGNVLLDTSRSSLSLLDFGLAALFEGSGTSRLSTAVDEAGFESLRHSLAPLKD